MFFFSPINFCDDAIAVAVIGSSQWHSVAGVLQEFAIRVVWLEHRTVVLYFVRSVCLHVIQFNPHPLIFSWPIDCSRGTKWLRAVERNIRLLFHSSPHLFHLAAPCYSIFKRIYGYWIWVWYVSVMCLTGVGRPSSRYIFDLVHNRRVSEEFHFDFNDPDTMLTGISQTYARTHIYAHIHTLACTRTHAPFIEVTHPV